MNGPPPLIEGLLSSTAYRHPVRSIELIETHISWVLLTGEFAYKIKKPVDLGFLDFSSLAKRKHACELEVSLNKRLAQDLYEGVVPITGSVDSPQVDGSGEAVEYAVKMRQFSPADTLDHRIETAAVDAEALVRFANRLVDFHDALPGATSEMPYGAPDKIAADARDNLSQLGTTAFGREHQQRLHDIHNWSVARATTLAEFMQARKMRGRVRECHGDLHLGNLVWQRDRIVAFDCLEFSADFRWIDTMDEVAFLVMDLLAHRRQDLAFAFLNAYLEVSGDYRGLEILRFYLVYRALVRSKVCALTRPPTSAKSAEDPERRAADYLRLAHDLAHGASPRLLLTHGFSGSGKSWVSTRLCRLLPSIWIRSDVERKRLHGLPADARTGAGIDQDMYAPAVTRQVYERCAELARAPLADGWTVIIDAAALKGWQRELIADAAAAYGVPFCLLDCRAPQDVLRDRVRGRERVNRDASEADLAVLAHQLTSHEPPTAFELATTVPIDTDRAIDWETLTESIAAVSGT